MDYVQMHRTAQVFAVKTGHTDIVRTLLERMETPDIEALDIAAKQKYADIVRILLAAMTPKTQKEALDMALKHGHADIVRILLDKISEKTLQGLSSEDKIRLGDLARGKKDYEWDLKSIIPIG